MRGFYFFFFFSSRRRHTRYWRDWSSDVCSSDLGLKLIPTLNKIDLPHARPDFVIAEMEQAVFTDPADVMKVSAKAGLGIEDLLKVIVERVPAPAGNPDAPLKALI